ncbi:phospholipase D-like domain-containing protein [Calothrix sp. PCC 6303]|uniref:phospholipase D-like domain-containing protein n=1 Tax=Calothrix sp. PCC 6303 TaxID=1170562 RepID=UPI001EF0A4EB|nr:phospholipase D-like domain-containing protein [Calothrix sp. PCC 6303]
MSLTVTACQQVKPQNIALKPLPQDPLIQVYFNHSQTSSYQEPYRSQKRPGDDLEQQIIDTIYQAKSSIDVAVQELRLPKIAQALVEKHKSGVKIRIILENTYNKPWSNLTSSEVSKLKQREREKYQDYAQFIDINKDGKLSEEEINQRDALALLNNAKIPKIDDTSDGTRGSDLMHHKFVIVDNRFLVVTSANFTMSDIHGDFKNLETSGNANNLLKIDSPELATIFTEEFNLMWGDENKLDRKFGLKKTNRGVKKIKLGSSQITINFSPISPTQPWINSSNGIINQTLEMATESVDMALFVFSEQRLANTLENRHQENVDIRAIIDRNFAYRPYSEALDMMGVVLSNKCKYEANNQPWKNPISTVAVPVLPKGDLLHHKFAIVDHKIVITGSHNWSEAANHGNDETLLLIDNPVIAAHYQREFDRIFKNSQPGLPQKIQTKIDVDKKQCSQIYNAPLNSNKLAK